jgi:hypothetical protein
VSSEILVDFHAPRLSVEEGDLGRRTCCCRVRQIYPWGYSLFIMSLNNSIKGSEKCNLFRRLGQQFLLLSGQIENDNEITENDFNIIAIK